MGSSLMIEIEEKIKRNLNGKPYELRKFNRKVFKKHEQEYMRLMSCVPKHFLGHDKFEEYENATVKGALEDNSEKITSSKPPRIRKIEELTEKLKTLRGKSLNRLDNLKRKGLKNRLKKKLKLEERMKSKSTNDVNGKKNAIAKIFVKKEKSDIKGSEENDVVYSKFNFPEGDEDIKKKKGPTDPMRILQKVEKSKKKMCLMEKRGRIEKVKEIKGKLAWKTAIEKAEGKKIKDDVELLKKSIRKIKNEKNRSKKKWEERENTKIQKMNEVQKKRKANIQKMKQEKQKKKTKKLVKKGRIIHP